MPDTPQPPPVPTPPDGVDTDAWTHGFQSACRFLAQQTMTVAKVQAQTHPPPETGDESENNDNANDKDDACPECGTELTDALGGDYCTDCGFHAPETTSSD